MKNLSLLIIQNRITDYNLPLYLKLSDNYNVTLLDFEIDKEEVSHVKHIKVKAYKLLSLYYSKENLFKIANNFDIVIAMSDLHWLQILMLSKVKKRKYRFIFWGIGLSASYKNRLNEKRKWDFIRFYFAKSADALIFYSDYPVDIYKQKKIDPSKLFVAHNTIEVNCIESNRCNREYILFIGTLYKEKGISVLLDTYKRAVSIDTNVPNLIIVGDGPEFENLKNDIIISGLSNRITLVGPVYKDSELQKYFDISIASISPNQAGLSVLKSMGFSVPFITNKNAITGGEIFNVLDDYNGKLYSNNEELLDIILNMNKKKYHYEQLGVNARKYYLQNRTIDHMAKGFIEAINYTLAN